MNVLLQSVVANGQDSHEHGIEPAVHNEKKVINILDTFLIDKQKKETK